MALPGGTSTSEATPTPPAAARAQAPPAEDPPTERPPTGAAPIPVPSEASPSGEAGAAKDEAPTPVVVAIPDLDIKRQLVGLDVKSSKLQVPEGYDDIGWWRDGPTPGSPGAAVMVGHLDSPTGPAVFFQLSSLKKGDPIYVRRSDGSMAIFRVYQRDQFSRDNFPSEQVYRDGGVPALHLITCGGEYDAEAGRYRDNVVVSAYLQEVRDGADKEGEG